MLGLRLPACTQALAVWVEKLCPFLVIMLFIFVQKHVVGAPYVRAPTDYL